MNFLPRTATAPFCPSEVKGSVAVEPGMGTFANGPGLKALAWGLFAVISVANVWLVVSVVF